MKMETQFPKIYGMQKAILRGKFTAIQAFSNKQPNLASTFSFRKRTNKAQSQYKEGTLTKIREEIKQRERKTIKPRGSSVKG